MVFSDSTILADTCHVVCSARSNIETYIAGKEELAGMLRPRPGPSIHFQPYDAASLGATALNKCGLLLSISSDHTV